jgi:hypothetical protein
MNYLKRKLDVKLVLTVVATLSTLYCEVSAFTGESPSSWTALLWTLPLHLSALMMLFDLDMDHPTMLLRLALFGLLIAVYAVQPEFGMLDVQINFAILFVWRWLDVVLMWQDWKKCNN